MCLAFRISERWDNGRIFFSVRKENNNNNNNNNNNSNIIMHEKK